MHHRIVHHRKLFRTSLYYISFLYDPNRGNQESGIRNRIKNWRKASVHFRTVISVDMMDIDVKHYKKLHHCSCMSDVFRNFLVECRCLSGCVCTRLLNQKNSEHITHAWAAAVQFLIVSTLTAIVSSTAVNEYFCTIPVSIQIAFW